jgi:hypothetical protein
VTSFETLLPFVVLMLPVGPATALPNTVPEKSADAELD